MTLREVIKMLRPYRKTMTVIMLLAIIISFISAISPFINQRMIDDGLLQGNIAEVITLVLLLIGFQVGEQIIEYAQRTQEIKITNSLGKRLKVDAFEHGLKLKPTYYKEQGFYKTINDALYDINNIMSITDNSFLTIFVIICKSIGAAIGLIILDWRLSILIACIIPIKIAINTIMRKRAERLGDKLMVVNKKYNTWFQDIISGIVDIKLWNLQKKTVDGYDEHIEKINQSSKNLSLMSAKNMLITTSIEHILLNSMYILGAFLIVGEQLTFGGLVAFISFSSYLLLPVNIIMDLRIILKQIAPSVDGIKKFNALEEENYDASLPLASSISKIEFKNVSVTLGGRDILKDVNFVVNKGEKVVFVGDNGSGKTTIINLLLQLYQPSSGVILIDDIPMGDFNVEDYRHKISVVTQDIHLFRGSVKDNIELQNQAGIKPDNEQIRFAVEAIEKLDDGFNTQVGSDGTKLSGGERQKIALLRALNKKSEILVLDEATSNYDKQSDENFNTFIKNNHDYDFYFVVTHRKEFLAYADKVFRLKNGKVQKEVV